MAEMPEGQFACPHCGRRFKWKGALAGKAVACKCGGQFRVPSDASGDAEPIEAQSSSGGGRGDRGSSRDAGGGASAQGSDAAADAPAEDDDTYELNLPDDEEPAAPASSAPAGGDEPAASAGPAKAADDGKCPNCNQPITPGAVLCVKCGFNLQEGRKIETEVAADDEDAPAPAAEENAGPKKKVDPRAAIAGAADTPTGGTAAAEDEARRQQIINVYLPGALIALGVAVNFLEQVFVSGSPAGGMLGAAIAVIFKVVLWVPLAFIGMLIAVKILGVAFGTLGLALYKLIAIALAPGAIWSIIAFALPIPFFGQLLGLAVAVACYVGFTKVLFDLEMMEAIIVIVIIIVLQMIMTAVLFLGAMTMLAGIM